MVPFKISLISVTLRTLKRDMFLELVIYQFELETVKAK